DSAAELAQQARADVMLRPQSSIDTRQMNAETIEAQLAAATSAVDAREAAPTTMNDAPAPASVQVAQAQRDAQVTTPTAPRARAQSEAQGAAPAPRSTSAPQQAPMRDLASAEMMGASMQPQEAAQQIVSGRATLQAESARVATRIDPAEVAERGTLQTAELQARSDVRTPAAARASEAMEAVRPALASAAVSPEARPAPPAGQMASGRMASETLAPARTRQSVAGANVQVTAQDATEAVVDMPVLTRAPSIGVQGEANVQASVSSPGAGLDASVRHPVVEAAVALDAAAPASELSKSPAPMGSVVSSSQQGVATAMLTPAMTQQPVDAGALSRTQPSEVVMAAVASDWQPSTIDAPRMNEQARVQAPSGQAAQQQAALVEEASGPATVDAQSLEQLRPDVLHRAMSTGAEPVRARAFGAATRSSEVLSQSVDVEVAPSSLAHIPSQSELVLRDTPGLPVLGGTVLRAPGAVTSGMPSSSEVVAAEAVVVDALSPDFTSRPALAPAGHPSMSPTAALRLEPMATNTAALRVDRVEVASPMGAAAPDLSGPAVEVQLAMTDVAPPALRIPEAPREPQMYPQREEQARKELVEQGGGSAETEAAVADALRWLAANQQPDGRWSGRAFDDKCQCGGRSAYDFDKALTGLSLLCFLATDNTHMKPGPYQGQVARALNWLVAQQREDGSLFYDESMYSHGIATIALCEAYGMSGDAALREPVEKAVAFIVRARNDVQGGWRYEPGQPGDTSVLGWQVMAMQSARKCGIDVPEAALDNARSWLDKVALEGRPGLYAYQVGAPVSMSMTAEGMFVRQLLGMGQGDPRMDQSAQFILRELPDWERNANTYGWYYATLALYQHHGAAWEQWNARLSEQLVGAQRQDGTAAGSWDPSDRWSTIGGRVYQTAICCLTLEVYYRYLPRFIEES
ncbi:MAG: hypothetical protein KDA20_07470, partial [Phycisphaerales bacterium]|nr:hypothetical protein [Phycisphaerales bacterium]